MTKKFIIILIIIMFLSFILAGVTFYATGGLKEKRNIDINEEKILSISDVENINIESISADIKFILVDSEEIKAKLYGELTCFFCETDYSLEASKVENNITIDASSSSYGIMLFSNVKLDIYLPKTYSYNLKIETRSGDVTLSDLLLDEFNLDTISGDVNIQDLTFSKSKLTTISGDFNLKNVSGDINYESKSGDLDLTDFSGDITGSSASGDYEIEEIADDFTIILNSLSGDTKLNLYDNASFHIVYNTKSGDIRNNFTITIPQGVINSDDHFEGIVGDGRNKITIKTISGDLLVK